MLDPLGRGAIIALSALCVAGAFALAPIRGRTSTDGVQFRLVPPRDGAAADTTAIVPIRRDPFAEPTAVVEGPRAAAPVSAAPGTSETLPANLTSDTMPDLPGPPAQATAGRPRVTAIITGTHPYAMLESGGVHEIKGLGDRVAGSTIVSIGLDGVRLENGADFAVDSTGTPR